MRKMHMMWPFGRSTHAAPQPEPERDAGERKLHKALKYLLANLTRVPFAKDVLAAYYCTLDRQTPRQVRIILAGALAYFVMPADAIPDILAVIGFTDDAGVLMSALMTVRRHILPRHTDAAAHTLEQWGGAAHVRSPPEQA
jgi:uncharacterized membrane protein YkvA (DUF1232 family)